MYELPSPPPLDPPPPAPPTGQPAKKKMSTASRVGLTILAVVVAGFAGLMAIGLAVGNTPTTAQLPLVAVPTSDAPTAAPTARPVAKPAAKPAAKPTSRKAPPAAKAAVPTVDPAAAANEGVTYHRIVNADWSLMVNAQYLDNVCSTSLPPGPNTFSCNVGAYISRANNFLNDLNSVPVPPGYGLGNGKIKGGLNDALSTLDALAQGNLSQTQVNTGVAAYSAALSLITNGIQLLP